MTTAAFVVSAMVLALLAGASFVVLYQMYHVLKKARALLDDAGPRLVRALDHVSQAADDISGFGSTLEAEAQMLKPLFETASSVGRSIDRSGKWLMRASTLGAALGPALLSGLRSLFHRPARPKPTAAHSLPRIT